MHSNAHSHTNLSMSHDLIHPGTVSFNSQQTSQSGVYTSLPLPLATMNSFDSVLSTVSVPSSRSGPTTTSSMTSILASSTRQRAESFVVDEIRLMLQEIGLRKHIILSMSPSTNRMKHRAWEEISACMAIRWPHSPKRSSEQVKKKWENLVSKTKRKLRAGHTTPELDWSETNSVVMEFLAQHNPLIHFRYMNARNAALRNSVSMVSSPYQFGPSSMQKKSTNSFPKKHDSGSAGVVFPEQISMNGASYSEPLHQNGEQHPAELEDIKMEPLLFDSAMNPASDHAAAMKGISGGAELIKTQDDLVPCSPSEFPGLIRNEDAVQTNPTASLQSINDLPRSSPMISSLLQPSPTSLSNNLSVQNLPMGSSVEMQRQWMEHEQQEHQLRMDILRLQKRAWEVQLQALASQSSHCNKCTLATTVQPIHASMPASEDETPSTVIPCQNGTQ